MPDIIPAPHGGQSLAMYNESAALATRETASSAVAAQAQAAVQARYIVAMNRPRNIDVVRQGLLRECRRSSFAKVARYHKPIGKKGVDGLSIRFVEAAIRCMTNILVETPTIYDDEAKRIVRVIVMDLETNATYSRDVTINKTVERKSLREGQRPISQRINSQGELTYTVEATDDDILNKENALVSKAIRTCGLRIIPGDLADECESIVKETLRLNIEQDPDAERKLIADSFAKFNIHPSQLARFIGCDLGEASPDQVMTLNALYNALKDGEVKPADLIPPATSEEDKKSNKLQDVLDRQRKKIVEKRTQKREAKQAQTAEPQKVEQQADPVVAELKEQMDAEPVENPPFEGDPSKPTPEELAEQNRPPQKKQSAEPKKATKSGRSKAQNQSQSYEPPQEEDNPLLDWHEQFPDEDQDRDDY